jgi:hypothetical protein
MADRRWVLKCGAAALLGGGLPLALPVRPLSAEGRDMIDMKAESGVMRFRVERGGSDIGTHEVRFTRTNAHHLKVAVDIDLKVSFGPFTLFSYTHRNRTVWSDGRILHLATRTDDDGDRHEVEAKRQDDGDLRVTTKADSRVAPGDILPTSYWIAATPDQRRLLNTQNGELAEVSVAALGTRDYPVPGGQVTATGYEMDGDVRTEVWYDPDGRWVGLSFDGKGEDVVYTLKRREGFLPTSPRLPEAT